VRPRQPSCGDGVPGEHFHVERLHRATDSQDPQPQPDENPVSVTILSYVRSIFNHISRVLFRPNIKSVGLPPRKISSFFRSFKDDLELRIPGVYSIPCECGQVNIGQTGGSVDTRLKGHQRHLNLEHLDRSAVAEQSINLGHRMRLQNTTILSTKTRYVHGSHHQGGDLD
jgi:hypothetical protein